MLDKQADYNIMSSTNGGCCYLIIIQFANDFEKEKNYLEITLTP